MPLEFRDKSFLNTVLVVTARLQLAELYAQLRAIETEMRRIGETLEYSNLQRKVNIQGPVAQIAIPPKPTRWRDSATTRNSENTPCSSATPVARLTPRNRNAPRVIDIDIIYVNQMCIQNDDITVPHPRWAGRRFVVQPLADVRPEMTLPGESRTVQQILLSLPETPEVVLYRKEW